MAALLLFLWLWALLFFLLSGLCLRRVQLMGAGNDRASEDVSRRVCRCRSRCFEQWIDLLEFHESCLVASYAHCCFRRQSVPRFVRVMVAIAVPPAKGEYGVILCKNPQSAAGVPRQFCIAVEFRGQSASSPV